MCKVVLELPKIGRDESIFTTYSATGGMRIYGSDLTTYQTIVETSFDYELTLPDYQFGDDFEFDERPYDDAVFTATNTFEIGDYVDGAEGTGFQVVQGLFKAIPSFETTMWQFKFGLEMPAEYFDTANYLFQYATYSDVAGNLEPVTVACGVQIANAASAEVFEYDATFDATSETGLPAWETNWNAKVDDMSYMVSPETNELNLVESANGNMRQSCNVRVEV